MQLRWPVVASLLLALLLSPATASEKSDWEKAQKRDMIETYQKFLDRYPKSTFAIEAKIRIEKLEADAALRKEKTACDEALAKGTLAALEAFVDRYRHGALRSRVRERINSHLAALRSLNIRRIAFQQQQSELLRQSLEQRLREAVARVGFELVPSGTAEFDATLTLSDFNTGVPGGSMVSFSLNPTTNTLAPTAWASAAVMRVHDRRGTKLIEKDIWGSLAGKSFFGGGPDPNSLEAARDREASLSSGIIRNVPIHLVRYFGGNRSPDTVAALAKELEAADYQVRADAIRLLGEIGTRETVPLLIAEARRSPGKATLTRKLAMDALAEIGDQETVPPLIELLEKDIFSIKESAIQALGQLGDQRSVPALIAALSQEGLRRDAAAALRKITGQDFAGDQARWGAWWQSQR